MRKTMGKDNLKFRQRPYGSKPIVFKRPDQWGHQPTSEEIALATDCLLYTSPSPRDYAASRMPSSA